VTQNAVRMASAHTKHNTCNFLHNTADDNLTQYSIFSQLKGRSETNASMFVSLLSNKVSK